MIINRNELNSGDIAPVLASLASENLLDSLAMEFGDWQLREVCEKSPELIAHLLAAHIYRSCRNHWSNPHFGLSEREINRFLKDLTLNLKVDDHDGHVYTEVEGYPWLCSYSSEVDFGSTSKSCLPFGLHRRRERQGRTIYQIQINLYLTADVIHQLNVNPKEVINMVHEQLKDEVSNIAVRQTPPDKEP